MNINERRVWYAVAPLLGMWEIAPSTYYGWVAQAGAACERAVVDRAQLAARAVARSWAWAWAPRGCRPRMGRSDRGCCGASGGATGEEAAAEEGSFEGVVAVGAAGDQSRDLAG